MSTDIIGGIVYALCATTCLACALLLGRAYVRSRQRLLFWSTICFSALFINNLLTFIDLIVVPDIDLRALRSLFGITGVGALAFGLIWEAR
jgi:hypothetical protein